MAKISAVDIKRLWYTDEAILAPSSILGTALSTAALASFYGGLASGTFTSITEVENVHQDTWTFEEAEPSQDFYRNQLTGKIYRASRKTDGDVTVNFTIGQYDYTTKAAIIGGEVIGSNQGWKRPKQPETKYKSIIFLTDDDQLCIIPRAAFNGREADADKAVGLAVTATEMEPQQFGTPEIWYDAVPTT